MNLRVCSVQKFSLHDGPGIRTTFFLSGCPLRCKWCHNPETHEKDQQLLFEEKVCINCGICIGVCPLGAHSIQNGYHLLDRNLCNVCGKCAEICPTGALRLAHSEMTVDEALSLAKRDEGFYNDDGGVTFSGGEPLMQWDAISEFCNRSPFSVAIETCGYAEHNIFLKMLEKVDYVMFDIKLFNEEDHIKYTGFPNKLILENYKILKESNVQYCIRTPLIPNITDTEENLNSIKNLIGDDFWEKLPYNPLTPQKYEWLGKEFSL